MRDLETDLRETPEIVERVRSDPDFAQHLYAALCNTEWRHPEGVDAEHDDYWACTWRYAGGLVAELADSEAIPGTWDMTYMHFYCSGNEGSVSSDVREALGKLGWTAQPMT